ncbi:4-hydroxy-2-oxoheptanedioate aldolase [Azoarcus indigens]|uniref:2,4-dihydroxyhept-2-enedioate aldolase n=1 Tax=Azoarcus indigens TaxID=29545 RepID=A0A4R6DVV3_9RHOO|nr:4-hydroxy-2-oxoheptanedioate aldolase [Azoarcus indigens]NMG64999.1 4-hydroxy-2-oxoheptanedioate aldolase [Azoarcus indigens]TDN48894.1 2,4-dihydroxyhept-2-enedioate aldolase [Azoarcus indigens]
MQMPENRFKRALAAPTDGQPLIGLFLGLADPYSAEIVAGTGYDWLMVDGEHGPNELRTVLAQLQALAAYPVSPVVRTADHNTAAIKRLLDIGAQTLLVPMVESGEQARALVAATRYPPAGIRGVGTALARAARWNGVPDYFARADEEVCLILQVESRAGLAAIEDIAAVEGVDGIFVGPSDLAASLGYLGQPGHPEVKAAVEDALARIAAAGKAAGVFASDPATARGYCEKGARFAAVGVDTLLLRNAALRLAQSFKGESGAAGAAY